MKGAPIKLRHFMDIFNLHIYPVVFENILQFFSKKCPQECEIKKFFRVKLNCTTCYIVLHQRRGYYPANLKKNIYKS